MLQYLLGYNLPIRRLTGGVSWSFESDHIVDSNRISPCSKREDIVAMLWINRYRVYVLCDDLSQYQVRLINYRDTEFLPWDKYFLEYTHLVNKFDTIRFMS